VYLKIMPSIVAALMVLVLTKAKLPPQIVTHSADKNVDTLFSIHNSPEYWTIRKVASSGCVRLMNQDIIDLYSRVPKGSILIVI
jgi:lipoprotein-anchoring transpeptidase ErfK/SrfK